jgi:hypothetical protein
VRCLCVDGGTPQDILVLKALERELKLPAPITEYFDIAVGSQSNSMTCDFNFANRLTGGLLVLGLFCKDDWTIEDCFTFCQKFTRIRSSSPGETVPRSSFSAESKTKQARMQFFDLRDAVSRVKVTSATANGNTKSKLKEVFGTQKTLFECSGKGTKIAVIATRASDSRLCIFSNFNTAEKEEPGTSTALPFGSPTLLNPSSKHLNTAR